MAARLLPGGHSTTTSLLPGGYPPVAFCADFVEIFPKILVNQEKFVSL